MRSRKLRIAWSIVCGTACLLLIALWVRSYWWKDSVSHTSGPAKKPEQRVWAVCGQSCRGSMGIYATTIPPVYYHLVRPGWGNYAELVYRNTPYLNSAVGETLPSTLGFRWRPRNNGFVASVPDWFPVLLSTALAAVPWIHWSKRFSLRALLIATTLVAVVLGLLVAMLGWQAG
jgi:hypothetical protein